MARDVAGRKAATTKGAAEAAARTAITSTPKAPASTRRAAAGEAATHRDAGAITTLPHAPQEEIIRAIIARGREATVRREAAMILRSIPTLPPATPRQASTANGNGAPASRNTATASTRRTLAPV